MYMLKSLLNEIEKFILNSRIMFQLSFLVSGHAAFRMLSQNIWVMVLLPIGHYPCTVTIYMLIIQAS